MIAVTLFMLFRTVVFAFVMFDWAGFTGPTTVCELIVVASVLDPLGLDVVFSIFSTLDKVVKVVVTVDSVDDIVVAAVEAVVISDSLSLATTFSTNGMVFGGSLIRDISILTPACSIPKTLNTTSSCTAMEYIAWIYFNSTPKVEKFLAIIINSTVMVPADIVDNLYLGNI